MMDKFRKNLLSARGFTLMELLIVIAIIAILTVAFLPNALNAPKKARDAVRIKKVQDIQTAIEAFVAEKSKLPEANANNCFTDTIAGKLGMSGVKDDSKLNSCSNAGDIDKYYYKSDPDNADPAMRHYIIGAIVEVKSNANTTALKAGLDAPPAVVGPPAFDAGTLDAAKALIDPDAEGIYYIAVGPI